MSESPLDFVLSEVRTLTTRPTRIRGAETEVYYDTRLEGEDGWDLIDSIIERFHTDFSAMSFGEYIPHEGADLRTLLVLIGRRPFKSLTVARLVQAIEAGEWRND